MNNWARHFDRNGAAAEPAAGRSAPPGHQYFAFLSYSHHDCADADWLHSQLERFRVPPSLAGRLTPNGVIPARLTPIFRDRHELAAGEDLGKEIREALEASHCLIILCSPAAAASKWTNAEIELFKRLHPDGCIIAVIVAGEPFASEIKGREAEECLPPALRQKYDRRGRATGRRAEPLAADLRESGDGRRLGFLKIVAGMLGVGLDDLVQRDQMRRQRRLAGITAASLAGMIVATVLAVTAIESRDAARDQRREAEGLVAFMLGDLKDKLEPIGRLDALDGVGSRILDYYSRQHMSELSDSALLQRSGALSLTAQVAYLRGNLDEAQRLYQEAMDGTAEAIRRDEDDAQRSFDHAQNIFWIGEISRQRGQIGQAEAAFREYKRLAHHMVAIEPDNLRWRMEVLYANENVGIVLYSQRRFAEASAEFEGALGPMESLASIDPDNREYQKELSNLLAWLADANRAQGRIDEAITVRERQLAFLGQLVSRASADVEFRQQLIPAHQALGILSNSRGDTERGIQQLRLAVAGADRVIQIEPDNTFWKIPAAGARLELARTLLSLGRRNEAVQELQTGCGLVAGLRARGPELAKSLSLRTNCLDVRSRLALASGSNGEALALADRALTSARAERSGDPITDRYRVAAAYRHLGDISQQMGDSEGARTAWATGLAQLPKNVVERPGEMNERAELLRRLGRGEQARPIVARLKAIGYRSLV